MSESREEHYERIQQTEWCREYQRAIEMARFDKFWDRCYGYILDRVVIMYLFVHKEQPNLPLLDINSTAIICSYLVKDWRYEKLAIVNQMEEDWKDGGWRHDMSDDEHSMSDDEHSMSDDMSDDESSLDLFIYKN